MPRILITGGHGLLGRPLTAALSDGYDVVSCGHADLDVTEPDAVAAALDEHEPDQVAHLAAWTDVDGCEGDPERAHRVNAEGTAHVARACAERGVDLLHVSTDYVFDGRHPGPHVETEPTNPLSVYGRSKLAAERAVEAAGGRYRIARCQSIYGHGRGNFVDAILARAASGAPLSVVTDQRVSPSWAADLADALVAILASPARGVFHVSNGGGCSWYECAEEALRLRGLDTIEIRPISAAELGRPAPRPANSIFDCGRLERVVGHRLPDWKDALRRYLLEPTPGDDE